MKIVIDMPEEKYEWIKKNNPNADINSIVGAVANGTPLPTGKWIIDGHHYKCSRCGKTLAIMFSETDDDDLIGCPFCLADMREKRKMKRKDLNETSCCGEQMWLDNLSWFADKYDEYVCHKCGKRKLIKKKEAENDKG